MSTFLVLTVTGLGLGAMYFLIASGLSLIYGLMGVLNFAHGAFITVGAYSSWWMSGQLDGVGSLVLRFLLAAFFGLCLWVYHWKAQYIWPGNAINVRINRMKQKFNDAYVE